MNPLPIEPAEVRQVGNKTIYFYRPQQIYKYIFDRMFDTDPNLFYRDKHSPLACEPGSVVLHMKQRHYTSAI